MAVHRLYIDESGTHGYSNSEMVDKKYLALSGVCVKRDDIPSDLIPSIAALKDLVSPDPDHHFTLHREEIIAKSGIYSSLQIPEIQKLWNSQIFSIIDTVDFVLFTVVIDKTTHKSQYFQPDHPYHYCLAVILEKYCSYLESVDGTGDVMAEARGKLEDRALLLEYDRFHANGTQYWSAGRIQKRLSSKKIKLQQKDGIAGLELADLLVLASKLDVLISKNRIPAISSPFMRDLIGRIQSKYYRNTSTQKIDGYGKKLL